MLRMKVASGLLLLAFLVGFSHAIDVKSGDDVVGTLLVGGDGVLPGIILIAADGMSEDLWMMEQAKVMSTADTGAHVMILNVKGTKASTGTGFDMYSNEELSAAVEKGLEAFGALEAVDATKLGVVGYGMGGNAVLAAAAMGIEFHAGVAYTPFTAKIATFAADKTVTPTLLIMPDYGSIAMLAKIEANVGANAKTVFEVFMQYDTKTWFNVKGNANYKESQAGRALQQTASFVHAVWTKVFMSKGTVDPTATAKFTPETFSYMDGTTSLPGMIVRDPTLTNAHAVLVIPAWTGFDAYAVARLHYLAELGYVAMSANIYGLPIGDSIEDMSLRIAETSKWRQEGNETKGLAFTTRINAARDFIVKKDYVKDASAIGFCFGGTGVYNAYRFDSDMKVMASVHGDMLKTRDFKTLGSNTFKGYLAMFSGMSDAGESGDVLVAHLGDISKFSGKWELTRYSNTFHGYSSWTAESYNPWAEGRTFQSFARVLSGKDMLTMGSSGASSTGASLLLAAAAALVTLAMA